MNFKDKQMVVIGGSTGIGLEMVTRLAESGAQLTVASRTTSPALDSLGVRHIVLDVTSDSVSDFAASLPTEVHGLVYCPGTITLKGFRSLSLDDIRRDMEVNYVGAVRVIQSALPVLQKSKHASVVLFSTVAAQTGMGFHASIAPAKAAVEGLVRSLAAEFARQGIRFNAVAPSLTDTPLSEALLSSDSKRDTAAARHPLKRIGTPADIAAAALYLLSEDSSWVTGQILPVDGGMSALRPL